ncbi:thiol:disulfide interchange protein DsbA/DsbL [Polynucleobacter sp. MWH-Spelu-300-X4]|uniref:thiol:disulfide interchange protein DsbA/DsbL n=1 Tax=Polynucleobacter sp. MWH-Spelu-300-X4 TaxID=2689109 RepID=UPI001BFDEC24|nr:thiol:disulfide interchange protein DsbA/DsbL [Polynucleobacter sp. MWH-Spelu-300-X4]QWD79695.1 thiol:disulfide interchange protein DsbA/DsbL [Polynucleobacter sp. MWH-Spelu-300-X4]
MTIFTKFLKVVFGVTFLLFATFSIAQNRPIEDGFDFRTLPVAQPIEAKGKIEVIEFFWYGCPHCHDFEPEFSAWVKRQGADVVVRKIPVAFRDDLLPHSQLFYALEALGRSDLHPKVMDAIHVGKKKMLSDVEIADWLATQGVDRQKFLSAFKSFTVISKARGTSQIAQNYRIDGVPTVAIQGKYITSPSIAGGSKTRAIDVMDYLVNKARKEKR